MNFEKAEKYRAKHPLNFPHKEGDDFGWFEIPSPYSKTINPYASKNTTLNTMVAPSDSDWQHISISVIGRCPSWREMCFVKDLFFSPEDVVVQFHPKKSEYVNMAKTCLHLWKWNGGDFPTPPKILVGA